MNGINNQAINAILVQDLNLDRPVEEGCAQESPQVEQMAIYVAELSSDNTPSLQKKKWTEVEDEQLITLKKQPQSLSWVEIAGHIPGKTRRQCSHRWEKLKLTLLKKEQIKKDKNQDSMIVQQFNSLPLHVQVDIVGSGGIWTEEENKRFIALKQQKLKLSWKEFAKHFPGKTSTQCRNHWNFLLKPRLLKAAAGVTLDGGFARWTEEANKQFLALKQQQPSLNWKDFSMYFPGKTRKQCIDHWHTVLKNKAQTPNDQRESSHQQLDEFIEQNGTEFSFVMPEAVTPIWTSEEDERLINLQQQCPELSWADIAQHFPGKTGEQCQRQWPQVLAHRSIKKRKFIEEESGEHTSKRLRTQLPTPSEWPLLQDNLLSLEKEKDGCYQKLNHLSIKYQGVLKKYSSSFSLKYEECVEDLFSNIELQLELLKHAQQDWRLIAFSLEEIFSRLQEIELFFQSFDNIYLNVVESNVIARIKNEMGSNF